MEMEMKMKMRGADSDVADAAAGERPQETSALVQGSGGLTGTNAACTLQQQQQGHHAEEAAQALDHQSEDLSRLELLEKSGMHDVRGIDHVMDASTDTAVRVVSGGEATELHAELGNTPRAFGELQLIDGSGSMSLSVAELEHASDQFLSSGLPNNSVSDGKQAVAPTQPAPLPTGTTVSDDCAMANDTTNSASSITHVAGAIDMAKLDADVSQWLSQSQTPNGDPSSQIEDDILQYVTDNYPAMWQADTSIQVFEWLHRFLRERASSALSSRFSDEMKATVVQQLLEPSVNLPAMVGEIGLKCATTLLFWRFQWMKQSALAKPAAHEVRGPRRRGAFEHEKELLDWVLSHKDTPITNHDILVHVTAQYPDFVSGKSTSAISVWIARFLKRQLPSEGVGSAGDYSDHDTAMIEAPPAEQAEPTPEEASSAASAQVLSADQTSDRPRKRRGKRGSPQGYVLHSNEFKLNAIKMLDEGKTINEVATELGLKCPNTLVYWNSIRDKLAVADKKRFRLAGGGRRSTCTFEDELTSWVSNRHHNGLGTDVKCVLDYLREFHSSFTEGKKEPTLRKWILRFFQRWRRPSVSTGAVVDDDLDKVGGILV